MLKLKVTCDGVFKITEEGGAVALVPTGPEITRLEGLFYRPVGRNLSIMFQNAGDSPLHVVTGRKISFQSFEFAGGQQAVLTVKPNKKGCQTFGLAEAPRLQNPQTGDREFSATVFEIPPGGGRRVRIGRSSVGLTATLVRADFKELLLETRKSKVFRETDRVSMKELINWILQGQLSK